MLRWLVNPAQRVLLGVFLVVFLLAGGLLLYQTRLTAVSLVQDRMNQTMALLGYLSDEGYLQPADTAGLRQNHQELAAVLEGHHMPDQLASGRKWLASYSLDDADTAEMTQDFPFLRQTLAWRVLPVSLIAILLLGVLASLILRRVFQQVLAVAGQAVQTAAQPDIRPDEAADRTGKNRSSQQEGDLAALNSAFLQLAEKAGGLVQALKADKQYLKDFLSDISHQVKTPLATLRLDHELLLGQPEMLAGQREEFLRQNVRQLDRIEWLIQGLLKMARLEAGVVRMNRMPARLLDTVRQAAAPFRELLAQKRIRLETDVPEAVWVDHDPDWVAEAISNLLKNALEHTPDAGLIRISAVRSPVTVQLKVSDSGPGLAPEEIPRIFERFYKKSSQAASDSVGIGLSLAKTIFEQNGAALTAASLPGQGALFTATFLIGS